MQTNSLNIAVKGVKSDELKEQIKSLFLFYNTKCFKEALGCAVTIEDYKEAFLIAKNFLEKNNLDDENPFFNDFDMTEYSLQVEFDLSIDSNFIEIIEPAVFVLAQKISLNMKTKCLVLFSDMTLPVGLFDNGRLVEKFEKYNTEFFKKKHWIPR